MGLFIVFIIIIIYVALSQSVKQSNNQNRRGNNPAMGRPPQQIYRPQMNQPQRTYQQVPKQQHTYQQTMNQPQRAYQQAPVQPHPMYQRAPDPQMNRQQAQQQLKNRLAEKYQSAAAEEMSAMEVIEPMEFTYDIPQSDNMKKVQELMVTGFSGNLNFERDFVAEGIETEEQLNYLRAMHCDMVQGYIFSKPLSISDFEKWCANMQKNNASN